MILRSILVNKIFQQLEKNFVKTHHVASVSKDRSWTFSSIVDGVKGGINLAVKNKDLMKSVGKTVGSVSTVADKISDAAKTAQWLNELKEPQRIKQFQESQQSKPQLPSEVKQAIKSILRNKTEDGFEKI